MFLKHKMFLSQIPKVMSLIRLYLVSSDMFEFVYYRIIIQQQVESATQSFVWVSTAHVGSPKGGFRSTENSTQWPVGTSQKLECRC